MDEYQRALELLLADPAAQNWPELAASIRRALVKKPLAWDFPLKACLAVGAEAERALPGIAAMVCTHMALILVDDLLDEDPRGEYLKIGAGRAANLAVGLYALGVRALQAPRDLAHREQAVTALNDMMQTTAYGQNWDAQNLHSEESYWAVTRAKSSPYFATGLFIGALNGGASLDVANGLHNFGSIFGEIMQIHDDLNDCLASPANVDWLRGRSPLPILFAESVDHPARERFVNLLNQVTDEEKLREAQSILVSCGAISYCVNELLARKDQAQSLLQEIQLADPQPLQQLLDQTIAPVKHLFASVGAQFSDVER